MGLIGEIYADAGLHIDSASFGKYGASLKTAEGQISDLASTSQTLLAGAFTLPAAVLTGIAAYGVSVASGFEDASTTLTTLYGNLDTAKEKFTWLGDFAASTPFEFPELMDATIKLKAYGIEAQDYLGVLGDTASAMGKPLEAAVEALADAQTGEFERMKEFGIKAAEITKKNYIALGATIEQVGQTGLSYTDKFGKQQLAIIDRNNREMITSTITAIWSDKYAGAMEARSKTLSGLMSTLKDNLSMGLADLVGYDMKNMEVQTASILGIFKELTSVAVDLTSSLSDIPEPVQAIITVAALGAAGVGLMAAGFIAYNAILPLATAETAIFGYTLSASIWPVTAVVAGLALLAGGFVYLEQKTGLVSEAWQVFSDVLTITWGVIKDVGSAIYQTFTDIYTGVITIVNEIAEALDFSKINVELPNFGIIDGLHELAEGYRNDGKTIETAVKDTGDAVAEAETVADDAHGLWRVSAEDFAAGLKDSYGDVSSSVSETKTEYMKALEDLQKDVNDTEIAGIKISAGKFDVDDLRRGIRTVKDELIILNDAGELVKVTADGAVTPLRGMGELNFQTTQGGLTILTQGADDTGQAAARADKLFRDLDQSVIVLGSDIAGVDGQSLGNVTNQGIGLNAVVTGNSVSAQILKGDLSAVDGQQMSNIITQITGVSTSINTGNTNTGNWKTSLLNVNNTPFSLIQSNITNTGTTTDASTGKAYDWNAAFAAVNGAPMSTIQGNVLTTGFQIATDTTKTETLNSTLGSTNSTPFGTLFGNLVTGGVKVGELKTKTDTTNTSMKTLGSFSFSSTLSGLGSIYDSLGSIYSKAVETINKLKNLGSASSSSSGGSSSGSNKSATSTSNKSTTTNNYSYYVSAPASLQDQVNALKRATS